MNWYLVKMVYRIIVGEESTSQFEEQLRLIEANSPASAIEKAYQTGVNENAECANHFHSMVKWKFLNVTELYRLHQPADGAEIFSTMKEVENGVIAEELVHKRAAIVRANIDQHLLDIY